MTDNVTFGANTFATKESGGVHTQVVTTPDDTFTVTPTLDTGNAYAIGDVLFATTLIDANTSRGSGFPVVLNSLVMADKVDRSPTLVEILLLFFDANTSIGTINATYSLSDAGALTVVGALRIYISDYGALGTCALVDLDIRPRQMKPSGTALYFGGITLTAGTYTNGDLQFKLGFNR